MIFLFIYIYWYRFRDDVFDIWTHGAEALFEFTDFLNSVGKMKI